MLGGERRRGLLIERQARQVTFRGTGARGASQLAGGFSRVGTQEHRQPRDGALIEFPLAAHITDPGREVGHHD